MQTFHCDHCGHLVDFENVRCDACGHALGYQFSLAATVIYKLRFVHDLVQARAARPGTSVPTPPVTAIATE